MRCKFKIAQVYPCGKSQSVRMDEQTKRFVQTDAELLQRYLDLLALLHQVSEVEKMPDISDAEKKELREAFERIREQFKKAGEVSDSQPDMRDRMDHVVATLDRLRETMDGVKENLARLLASRAR